MKKEWKYFISLNNNKWDYVEGKQTPNGLPIGNDFSVAKCFDSTEDLLQWVSENTALSAENEDFHIEGHYMTVNPQRLNFMSEEVQSKEKKTQKKIEISRKCRFLASAK